MGLPAAPLVEVRIPGEVFVGRPTPIIVEVTPKVPIDIEFISVAVQGNQYWVVGSGKSAVRHAIQYPNLGMRLAEASRLTEKQEFRTAFTLPPDTAPTHEHSFVHARLHIKVHVSIPWWPDGRYRFDIPVRVPPPPLVARQPVMTRNTADPGKPRLELSLASNAVVAGEALTGSFALYHVDDDKPRTVELALVPRFHLFGRGRIRERTGSSHSYQVAMPAGGAGKMVPFSLQLPPDLTPTFQCGTHTLAWSLVAKFGGWFGPSGAVGVQLLVFDRAAAAVAPQLAVPPRLADQQVVATFAHVAQAHGWSMAEPGEAGDPVIARELGPCTLSIAYVYRGEAGTALVAMLAHPSLGLDLEVTPGSLARHAFFHDIEAGVEGLTKWDRDHHVRARDGVQAVPALRAMVPALAQVPAGASFVRWTDDAIVYERPISTLDARDLLALADAVAPLAPAIEAALAVVPPPIESDVGAWREVAKALDGELVVGELAIDGGRLDGVPATIALQWDGDKRPRGLRVTVGDPQVASELARQVAFEIATPSLPSASAKLPDGVVGALASWPLEVTNLVVADGVARAEVTVDARGALDLARRLRALLALIDPAVGPYR